MHYELIMCYNVPVVLYHHSYKHKDEINSNPNQL